MSFSLLQELERQYSPSRWSPRMSADDVIKAHVKALKEGGFVVNWIHTTVKPGCGEQAGLQEHRCRAKCRILGDICVRVDYLCLTLKL